MVYMYHSFLIHSSADGHLGCFHILAMINREHIFLQTDRQAEAQRWQSGLLKVMQQVRSQRQFQAHRFLVPGPAAEEGQRETERKKQRQVASQIFSLSDGPKLGVHNFINGNT